MEVELSEAIPIADKPFWARCGDCEHAWIAGYWPMDLAKFCKIVKAHSTCPKCGGVGFIAKQRDGELTERDNA